MHKRVLITGGASGLGKALALRWAQQGSNVCIADLNQERAEETVQELQALNVDAFFVHCDITDEASVESVKQAIVDKWQGIDLVVNNAGIASADSLEDEDLVQWRTIMNVNLFGAVIVTRAFAPLMKAQNSGYFLNVASQAGITSIAMMASYNVSKAAMITFSETMRLELNDDNIGVSVLCPGFFKTNLKESLRTKSDQLRSVLDKVMERATITAEDVANYTFDAVSNKELMIVTHPEGRTMYRLKRWFPKFYLKKMLEHTARFRGRK
ncbi:SDR family oxidoreductase [Aliikangiella marina]|uniref:SDR family oxidoreductase n=1 Tax=Aliikangiella marina TaxID=1712262 RepID=A0A545TH92_9GAMM|nr:SDR family oxidoreductase [Aliikangiella marina]TQV76592.1 SDR family oxidoreductase [Aliikangiella marina]